MKIIILMLISLSLSTASDVFIDDKTGLTWQDDTDAKDIKKDWQGAIDLCHSLHLAGHDDWRLPSVKELQGIIEMSQDSSNKKRFKYIGGSGYYWSSSAHESSEEFAWMMNFKRGYEYNNYKTYERYVRCVRDSQ